MHILCRLFLVFYALQLAAVKWPRWWADQNCRVDNDGVGNGENGAGLNVLQVRVSQVDAQESSCGQQSQFFFSLSPVFFKEDLQLHLQSDQ